MFSFRLPLWVYWTLAALGVGAAGAFTVRYDFSAVDDGVARRILFTVWRGPLTLVIAALLVTWLKRTGRGR
mgnify:CR=1 FL=1